MHRPTHMQYPAASVHLMKEIESEPRMRWIRVQESIMKSVNRQPKAFRTKKASDVRRNPSPPKPLPKNVWERIEYRLKWRRAF